MSEPGGPHIRASVERALRDAGFRSPHQIWRSLQRAGLEVSVEELEKVLRRNPELFVRDRSRPPRWSLAPASQRDEPRIRSPRTTIDALPPLYPWQTEALSAWEAGGRRGVVEAVTGAGKTLLGVRAAVDAVSEGRQVVVLVPSTPLLEQWRQRLQTASPGLRVGLLGGGERDAVAHHDVVVATVQSAARRKTELSDGSGGLLVADECHRYAARGFQASLLPDYAWRLGLTATYARGDDGHHAVLDPYLGGVVFTLGYERALREEVIAPFRLRLLGVTLDPQSRDDYDQHVEIAQKVRSNLITSGAVPAEPFDVFFRAVLQLSANNQSALGDSARTYLWAFERYRRALAEAPAKLTALAGLHTELEQSDGSLIFTASIRSAEAIKVQLRQSGIIAEAVHSELDHADRAVALSRFASGRTRVLVAPKVLDEGIDVPDANFAVVVAASRTRRQMVQRMGRVIRPKPQGGHATFALLYARDTREDPASGAHETFLEEATAVAVTTNYI